MFDSLSPTTKSLIINGCLVILALSLGMSILVMIGGNKIFGKAKKNKGSAFIPIINMFTLLDISDMSSFWGILFFIPVVNLFTIGVMMYKLGGVFNCTSGEKIGLVLFPLAYYPLLAFGDNKYKVSDEEFFKVMDDARGESVNLLTDDEIDEQNDVKEEEKSDIDSIFKSDYALREPVGPYKAIAKEENKIFDDKQVENPFKPIEIAKQLEVIKGEEQVKEEKRNKFIEEEKKEKVEYIDL